MSVKVFRVTGEINKQKFFIPMSFNTGDQGG